jgi:hypothetical protein
MSDDADPHLAHLQVFPIKALDRETPTETAIGPTGALSHDRRWAIVDAPADEPHDPDRASTRGDYVNGKATEKVHRLRSAFEPGESAVTFRVEDGEREDREQSRRFPLDPEGDGDREAANRFLSAYFERPVSLRHAAEPGMPDRRSLAGPTVISTATLRAVASWVDVSLESARRRFRANVEIDGVPAFWEDRLYGDEGEVVRFRIGDAVLEGVTPCGRCVTPTRDPETGAVTPEFRERFVRNRRETAPSWTESERFEHYYSLAVTTRAPRATRSRADREDDAGGTSGADRESDAGETPIAIGDEVEILGTVDA